MSTLVHALERIKSQHLPSHQEVEALTQETPQVPRPHLQRHPDLCPLTVLQKALVGACQHDPIHPASSDFAGGVDLTDVETGRTSRVCQNPGRVIGGKNIGVAFRSVGGEGQKKAFVIWQRVSHVQGLQVVPAEPESDEPYLFNVLVGKEHGVLKSIHHTFGKGREPIVRVGEHAFGSMQARNWVFDQAAAPNKRSVGGDVGSMGEIHSSDRTTVARLA
ncbi:uncharacterized protein EI90DRAFT_3286906 [Cantharellus anzutake]|uniref:uncharacterized protein n=1 Tax=Cantharellus anzutake TaxID=1750568 RepID=UPI001906BA45|nr:uncharacterized protein EI90DRAFT_3286906 [Cantharellus anzutake]KAF8338207.1 hypothetical protein EI90DRAFT_3286906 [Cantharellus anzutake]